MTHRPLTNVIALENAGKRQEYHQKTELEKACLNKTGHHFTQAQYTPFLTPPLLDIFGKTGMSKAFTAAWDGNFTPLEQCNEYAAKFLMAVGHPITIADMSTRTIPIYC